MRAWDAPVASVMAATTVFPPTWTAGRGTTRELASRRVAAQGLPTAPFSQ